MDSKSSMLATAFQTEEDAVRDGSPLRVLCIAIDADLETKEYVFQRVRELTLFSALL